MKCDKCEKKATVHLTEIVDGKVMEMHLCEDCAQEQSDVMEQQFGLADLLAGLTDFGKHSPETSSKETLQCPKCGLTYDDFRKFGRFGCAECYVAFQKQLQTLLKKIHGSESHLGKRPDKYVDIVPTVVVAKSTVRKAIKTVSKEPQNPVEVLRQKLKQAIMAEDFELAAQLRDEIREFEKGKGE